MEAPKLNPQQTYIISNDNDLMALLVLAVNWKFWYMFIIEITLCSFVRLNGMIIGMLFFFWSLEQEKASARGISVEV